MVVSGLLILLFRRDRRHILLWLSTIAYWSFGGILQDLVGNNSIPYHNWLLALLNGYVATHIATKYRVMWPLIVAALMALTMLLDISYMFIDLVGLSISDYVYQRGTYLLFYGAIFVILVHPQIRKQNARKNIWVYA